MGCLDGTTSTINPGGPPDGLENAGLALYAPTPNPSRKEALIAFALPTASTVRLCVLDVQGREVAVLIDGQREAGRQEVTWSGAKPGTYFVRLQTAVDQFVRRLVVIR